MHRTFARRSLFPCLMLAALAPEARAQTFFGLAGGLNVSQGSTASGQRYSQGFAGQGVVGYRFASRFGVRLDALVSHFTSAATILYFLPEPPPCVSPGCIQPTPAFPVGTVGVAGLGANGIVDVIPASPGGAGMYAIAGGGAYYLFQHPTVEGAVRFGLTGGAGFELRLRRTLAIVLEARYHALVNAPSDPRWLVPLTMGVRF